MPKTVIFACTHSAGRSQMATAFFNRLAIADVRAFAAGLEPAERVHPEVVEVMNEIGFDLSGAKPQLLTARMQAEAAFLVTLGCGERCPMVPPTRRADWTVEDPKGQPLPQVRKIRDEVRGLVEKLVRVKGWASVS
jgi:arsenate reductase